MTSGDLLQLSLLKGLGFMQSLLIIFSRFTWLYPLKMKSDFLSVFMSFQTFVEQQLDCKIKLF